MIAAALLVLAMIFSLAFAAFCAGTETAFLSVSRERVLHLAREGGRKAKKVQAALADMGRTTTTLLIGNNLASVSYSAASSALALKCCCGSLAQLLWSLLAAFMVLYFSEFLPKLLCAARPLRRSLALAGPYAWVRVALWPLTELAMLATQPFMVGSREQKYRLTAADLERILTDRRDGVCLSDFESALIGRILVLRTKGKPVTPEALLDALK